ncbi:MAG: phenylalanine--tRNA ligase subunit beta [Acidimicrobiia bacterium]|nr:phenylalanine--tRNA ligase subunit beta [Acidimicrobiia bacterium]
MKVLLSWLREFAPGIEGAPADLAHRLSMLGMAVEEIELVGRGLDGVVVARVLRTRAHPGADKIQLVDVDAGDGEALQVCCGAFNMGAGDLVPLAMLGTTMADGRLIVRRKLRGEWSNGMLCSAAELGFGEDHSGIMILAGGAPGEAPAPGQPLLEAMGITEDVLFDLDITGNRPDALSVAGVARDLAAHLRVPFAVPEPKSVEVVGPSAAELVAVEILDPVLCGRFAARVLRDVQVGPSPRWLANRLLATGMRPINNVVDVSNYVMLELGQPSHTFDLDRVAGGRLRVRRAHPGEQLVTLDGQLRSLAEGDGVIADGDDVAVSIAGVMGGRSTEISGTSTDVLLEMAWWEPLTIARTSRRLNLRSEASTRFERGTDPQLLERALLRFAELLAPAGSLLPGLVDEVGDLPRPARARARPARISALLGVDISAADVATLLEPIGFGVEPAGDDVDVQVPSFRPDTALEVDVVEEVARHYGYERIPRRVPRSPHSGGLTPRQAERRRLRHTLADWGLVEAMPMPFLAPGDLHRAGLDADAVTVTNPLVAEESVLRTSLRPGLLATLAYNASHRAPGARLFEIGHVYLPTDRSRELPDEREHLAVALGGAEAPEAVEVWHVVADALALGPWRLVAAELAGLHPTRTAVVELGGAPVGSVGEVDPAVLEAYEVPERVAWLEVDLSTVFARPSAERLYRPFSRFPSSDIDLAFVTPDGVAAGEVAASVREAAGELLVDLALFDVYRGGQLGQGRRSLAYRLRLQASDRTLTDEEVATVRARVAAAVEATHGATLRS